MPVSYSYEVSNNKFFGLLRIIFRWKGSVWRVLSFELFIYFVLYAAVRLVKELVLTDKQVDWFDEVRCNLNLVSPIGSRNFFYFSCYTKIFG